MLTGISILCRCLGWYPIWLLLLSIGESAARVPTMGVLLGCSLLSFGCIRWLRLRLLYQKKNYIPSDRLSGHHIYDTLYQRLYAARG